MEKAKEADITEYERLNQRDQLIYDIIHDRYRLEWDRCNLIDEKASGIISFVGIIIGLQAGLGSILLKGIPKTRDPYSSFAILFFLAILILTLAIIFGLKAYYIKTWVLIPDPNHLIVEYGIKDRNRIDILRIVSKEMANSIEHNKRSNNEKIKFIRLGFLALAIGSILYISFIFALLTMG